MLNRVRNLRPSSSLVLTSYLKQEKEPAWTSYFVRLRDVQNDQYGMSHFNWQVGDSNYHILRVGCFPFIKYHCTKRKWQSLDLEDKCFRIIKAVNLGIPCLMYGLAATFLIRHEEWVYTPDGLVKIYFLIPENKGSLH